MAIQLASLSTRGVVLARQRGTQYQEFGRMYTKGLRARKKRPRRHRRSNIQLSSFNAGPFRAAPEHSDRAFETSSLASILPCGNTARFCFMAGLGRSYLLFTIFRSCLATLIWNLKERLHCHSDHQSTCNSSLSHSTSTTSHRPH